MPAGLCALYRSNLSKYAKWAKSLEPISSKVGKATSFDKKLLIKKPDTWRTRCQYKICRYWYNLSTYYAKWAKSKCQYKSCRYWSSRSKYGKWAKSLEPFLRKLAKSLILGHFGYKSAKIAKTHFFSRKIGTLLLF